MSGSGLTYTDGFCGAGGSSIGLTAAGLELVIAANHWERAIETHSANFPDAEHLCADLSNYDMRRLPHTDVAWFSPECTWHSPAGGRRRKRAQLDLFEEYVPDAAGERSRMTMVDVIRATEAHRYRVVIVENVIEVAAWELFDWWLAGMEQLGYRYEIVCVSSAHVWGAGNAPAPQWRDRIYVVFSRHEVPAPDVTLRPLAWCSGCEADVEAMQVWKRPERRHIGKYGQQYLYRCPRRSCRHQAVEPYVLPAAAAIDWSDLGERIGDRKKPLAAATMRRIAAGLAMFAGPVVAAGAGNTFERPGYHRVWPAEGSPLMARQATGVDGVATPVVLNVNHRGDDGRPYPAGEAPLAPRTTKIGDGIATPLYLKNYGPISDAPYRSFPLEHSPLGALTTSDSHSVVLPEPFITMLRNHADATGISDPLDTLAAAGRHHALTVPAGAFLSKQFGGNCRPEDTAKSVDRPLGTITVRDHHALVIPYRRGNRTRTTREPLATRHTKDGAALCSIEAEVADCHFRMLKPREHLRGQRFPDTYEVKGNQGEQTMQAGNAVSSNVAQWLGAKVVEALA